MSHRAGHRASPKLLNILEYLIALASPRSSDVATVGRVDKVQGAEFQTKKIKKIIF